MSLIASADSQLSFYWSKPRFDLNFILSGSWIFREIRGGNTLVDIPLIKGVRVAVISWLIIWWKRLIYWPLSSSISVRPDLSYHLLGYFPSKPPLSIDQTWCHTRKTLLKASRVIVFASNSSLSSSRKANEADLKAPPTKKAARIRNSFKLDKRTQRKVMARSN